MPNLNKVREYRLARAWSQEQLAEMAGLSTRTVQRIENGEQPSLETLSALAAPCRWHSKLSSFAHCSPRSWCAPCCIASTASPNPVATGRSGSPSSGEACS